MSEEIEHKTEAPTMDKPGRSKDDIALDLMKFVATTTGYGRGASTPGFGGKSTSRTPEEHADALLDLFRKCREVVNS